MQNKVRERSTSIMFKQLGDAINKQKANLNSLAASINQTDGDTNEGVEEDELTMRRRMISDGLAAVIEGADKELDEPIEEEAIQAMQKAASTLCYTKKYFDGSNDRMIYFPSVAKVILNFVSPPPAVVLGSIFVSVDMNILLEFSDHSHTFPFSL